MASTAATRSRTSPKSPALSPAGRSATRVRAATAPSMSGARSGEKLVLGHRIKAGGGVNDGEPVLDILAAHPSTARFISTKLARRFVERRAATGVSRPRRGPDSGPTVATSARSYGRRSPVAGFLAPDALPREVKSPFQFIVSAMRATAADVQDATPLVRALQQLGCRSTPASRRPATRIPPRPGLT